jgi:capsular polysaccharide transport system ATP-binding protein
MIVFERVTQFSGNPANPRIVLSDASFAIPADRRIALLGISEEDKKVVIDLLAGILTPHVGHITRHAKVSFPAGDTRAFAGELSVRSNVMHVARLYGVDAQEVADFVKNVVNMGASFDAPFAALPVTVRRQISQVLAYCLPFDVYILYEPIRAGSLGLAEVIKALFETRVRSCGIIVPMRDLQAARQFCDMGLLLHGRQAFLFDELDRAVIALTKLQAQ